MRILPILATVLVSLLTTSVSGAERASDAEVSFGKVPAQEHSSLDLTGAAKSSVAGCSATRCTGLVGHMIIWQNGTHSVQVILQDIGPHVGNLTACTPDPADPRFKLPMEQVTFDIQYAALLAALHAKKRVSLRLITNSAGQCEIAYMFALSD